MGALQTDLLTLVEASRVLALPAERFQHLVDRQLLAHVDALQGDPQFRRDDVVRLGAACHDGTHHHAVQFFDSEEFLCEVVARYLAEGIEADAPMVLIARPSRAALITAHLERDGLAPCERIAAVQLQVLDAHTVLAQFMVDGMPDPLRFREAIEPVIERGRSAFSRARLRAYGEMVDILWAQGLSRAAIRLEELWNELAEANPFSLLCGYCMSNFRGREDEALFARVCETHSEVSPTEACLYPGKLDAHRREVVRMQQRIRSLEARLSPGGESAAPERRASSAQGSAARRMREAPSPGMRILLVDDDPASRRLILEMLSEVRRPRLNLLEADGVAQGLALIETDRPDLCICDFRLSEDETALDLYRAARGRGSPVPFVGVTSNLLEEDLAETLLTAGFEDVVLKRDLDPINLHRVVRNAALRGQSTRKLIEIGTSDEMTGVLNRRGYQVRLETERRRCERSAQAISVLYLDLNRLKVVNDRYGHRAGDQLIKALVANLRPLLRSCDALGRLGGDEFCVALPGADSATAQGVATGLRERLAAAPLQVGGEYVTLSVSVGIHTAQAAQVTGDELIDRADAAMLLDKQRYRAGVAA